MSVINKVQARNAAGQPVGEAYDIGGSGSGGVFALQAYGTLNMAYKQMTIERIEGKWSELVAAIENGNEITLYANDTETGNIYPFKVQYVDADASDGEIYNVQFSTVAAIIFSDRIDTQISMGAILVREGSNDTIVTQSSRYKLDLLEAKNIPITDSGNYFTGNTVEAALQELGAASGGSNVVVINHNIAENDIDLDVIDAAAIANKVVILKELYDSGYIYYNLAWYVREQSYKTAYFTSVACDARIVDEEHTTAEASIRYIQVYKGLEEPGSDAIIASGSYELGDDGEIATQDKSSLVDAINELTRRVAALEGGNT